MRTFSTPPVTRTAPNQAAPFGRTMSQPASPGMRSTAPGLRRPGFFNRPGLMGGLLGGLFGAGLFGLLFGHGLFGGLGGIGSLFGLLLQIVLIVFVARLIYGWWQSRNRPALAGAVAREAHRGADAPRPYPLGGGTGAPGPHNDAIGIRQADLDEFERLLGEIQLAYGREDLAALRQSVTPEMQSFFAEELADNASRGVVNRIADVKLLQGDLAESWREDGADYATVAMRYSLRDFMEERESGRVVEGDPERPDEAVELWTFRRSPGGRWVLSAIQQA
jgi:predicted lipid-binding transport protein (Tim44 family)